MNAIPEYYHKDSRVQSIVNPEYNTKYVEIIVNDFLYRVI